MSQPKEEITSNRFEGFKFDGVYEWVAIHDESVHFPGHDPSKPVIKHCGKTLRIRANDAWTKLPQHHKEAMVAHEIGHREYQHYLTPNSLFGRLEAVLDNRVSEKEIQADSYAAKLIGKSRYIETLKELRAEYQMSAKTAAAYELELRIKELEK